MTDTSGSDTPGSDTPDSDTPGSDTAVGEVRDAPDRREPDDSPQRRLVESVQAYEVDPPAPERADAAGRPEGHGSPAEG